MTELVYTPLIGEDDYDSPIEIGIECDTGTALIEIVFPEFINENPRQLYEVSAWTTLDHDPDTERDHDISYDCPNNGDLRVWAPSLDRAKEIGAAWVAFSKAYIEDQSHE